MTHVSFVCHAHRLHRVRSAFLERALAGEVVLRATELRVVTAARDADLLPTAVYLFRAPLTDGRFTAESGRVVRALASPDCVTPAEADAYHRLWWPRDLVRQLAVALDVPTSGLRGLVRTGGPVLDAVLNRVSRQK